MASCLPAVISTKTPPSLSLNKGYFSPVSPPYFITGSSNAQQLYATFLGTTLATSYDGGNSWIFSSPSSFGSSYEIATSGDGTIVLASGYNGAIELSTNSGISFTNPSGSSFKAWLGVAMSSNAQYMYCSFEGGLYRSTNSGASFSSLVSGSPFAYPSSLACDATGQYVYMTNRIPAYVGYSSDYGVTWNTFTPSVGSHQGRCITCSSSGQYVYAVFGGSTTAVNIYASSNYGVSWSALSYTGNSGFSYGSIKCSSNGAIVFANDSASGSIVSYNYGARWISATPALTSQRGCYISPDATKFLLIANGNLYNNTSVPSQYVPSTITDLSGLSFNSGSGTFNGASFTWGAISNLKDGIITSAWFPTNAGTFTDSISITFSTSVTISRIRVWTIYNNSDYTPSAINIIPSGSGSVFSVSGLTSSSYSTPNNVEAYYDCNFSSTTLTTLVIQLTSCSSGLQKLMVNEVQFFSS